MKKSIELVIYQRFLKGVLIYRPQKGSDVGRVDMPIASLANPLEGTFDLSRCGDIGKYLSISTGYRKEKKAENASKVEIWIVPQFLIKSALGTTAHHLAAVNKRAHRAEAYILWTRGDWDDLTWYDYLPIACLRAHAVTQPPYPHLGGGCA